MSLDIDPVIVRVIATDGEFGHAERLEVLSVSRIPTARYGYEVLVRTPKPALLPAHDPLAKARQDLTRMRQRDAAARDWLRGELA